MFGVGEVISFFIGAFVGRYFEQILQGIEVIRKDLRKSQKQFKKYG